jgi:hypothetical protein
MPDTRKHRGPHPQDGELFARKHWPALQQAVAHLSWLLTRGYAVTSALKLVGDRFELTERQRKAVLRSSCSEQALAHRRSTCKEPADIAGRILHLDGFNVLTTIEAALAGGVLILGRDNCLRDMASMHGNYCKVQETLPALVAIGQTLASWQPAGCVWYLDRPVSNSGRLCRIILDIASDQGWNWRTEIIPDPDAELRSSSEIAVSADSAVIDHASAWFNLAHRIVRLRMPDAEIIPLNVLPSTDG